MTDDPEIEVVEVGERRRFEIRRGGEPVGLATYRDGDGRRTFVHTEIDPAHEGQGLGSELVRRALDATREQQLQVVPRCPFVARFIERHAEYADLLAGRE